MIVAQGVEADGHVAGEVSTIVLLPRIVDAVAPTLVLAAGGIANARGPAAALCLGADGVVMGTRFLATGDIEAMSLLAGESVGLINEIRPAAEILRETVSGAERLIRELSAKVH
jgi:NAD(P)H-dependent flavin oxidoreductase YrpB (nitropropane dioxygenase family)